MQDIHQILKKYWRYDAFRPLQEDIIDAVLSGKDTLALLPTGGGKSICFQVPALALEGICIVVSPLIALMKDQVENLKKLGVNAVAISSTMSKREIDITLDNCVYGDVKFLYLSPERLKTNLFLERFAKMNVGLLAIDEAHCISQWGYDFRPPYLEIAEIRKLKQDIPLIALTASATKEVCTDIQDKLEFKNGVVFQKSFARKNLSYSTFYTEDKYKRMLEILSKVPGSAVIYVRNRKKTKDIAQFLQKNKINADYYHAGLKPDIRNQKQNDWILDKTRVIVSTNAFGMGIDKPNVRVVIHLDIPPDLESYYQEAGRAGRDEKMAYGVLLYDNNDIKVLRENVENQNPSYKEIKVIYQALANFLRIAIGSGEFATYNFDLNAFSTQYNMNKVSVYYGLKKLENQGIIQLNDAMSNASKVFIKVSNSALYNFQLKYKELDFLLQILLRMYGGELFSHFMNINEGQIAKELGKDVKTTISMLQKLVEYNIINYEKKSQDPTITLQVPRVDVNNLGLNKAILDQQKSLAEHKIKSIINYTEQKLRCRTQMILEYFDEFTDDLCGNCDFCISERKKLKGKDNFKLIRKQVFDLLEVKEYALDDLVSSIVKFKKQEIVLVIRELLDSGELKMEGVKLFKT